MKSPVTRLSRLPLLLCVAGGAVFLALQEDVRANCDPPPLGLVSWWQAEGNGNDVAGTNNGTLAGGATFAVGEVGSGFSFNGAGAFVGVADSPSLRFTNELTVELWYKDTGATAGHYYGLLAKRGPYPTGSNFGIDMYIGAPSVLQVYIQDPNYSGYLVSTSPVPAPGVFHHLAATYRQAAAEQVELKTYVDGQLVQTGTVAGNLARTVNNAPVTIGADDPNEVYFLGTIDEPSIYNRALSAAEILAIFNAGTAGKCFSAPPSILQQPTNQAVLVGDSATFSVRASGSQPLNYQWTMDGTNLPGATNASILLTNVQVFESGRYAVLVTNSLGSILSSNALLTVTTPTCVTPPPGIVSWWPGEGNALDLAGTNNGTLTNGAGFGPGEVGQGFTFNGASSYIEIPNSSTLNFTNDFTVELWYKDTGLSAGAYAGLIAKRPYTGPCSFGLTIIGGSQGSFLVYYLDPKYGTYQSSTYSPLPAPGAWHHLAASFHQVTAEQLEISSYIDGTLVKVGELPGNLTRTTNNYPLHIGCSNPPGGEFFKGDIDEVSIYNRALTPSEIAAIFNAGSAGKCNFVGNQQDTLSVQGPIVFQGQSGTAFVNLLAKGNENAVGFSLSFDPTLVAYAGASVGSDAINSTMNVNAIHASNGQVGIALALPSDVAFNAGTRQLVALNFQALTATSVDIPLSLTDTPVSREVSDTNALSVLTSYSNGIISINPRPSLAIGNSIQGIRLAWPLWATNYNLQQNFGTISPITTWTNVSISPVVVTNASTVTLPLAKSAQFYRLKHQ